MSLIAPESKPTKTHRLKESAIKPLRQDKCSCALRRKCSCKNHPQFMYGYQCSCARNGECDCFSVCGYDPAK